MTGLHDTDIRLSDHWQLTQAADGDAPLCPELDCLYQNIVLEALTQPGDLFFYGSGSRISHVAIYIGNGQIVHASSRRTGIKISNAYYRSPICVVRVLD